MSLWQDGCHTAQSREEEPACFLATRCGCRARTDQVPLMEGSHGGKEAHAFANGEADALAPCTILCDVVDRPHPGARPHPSSLTPSKKEKEHRKNSSRFSRPTLSWRTGDTAEAEAKLAAASRPLVRGAPTPLIPVLPPRGAAVACPQRAACSVHRKHVFKTRRKAAAAGAAAGGRGDLPCAVAPAHGSGPVYVFGPKIRSAARRRLGSWSPTGPVPKAANLVPRNAARQAGGMRAPGWRLQRA